MAEIRQINTNIDIEIKSLLAKKILAVIFVLVAMFIIIYPIFALEGSTVAMKTQTAVSRTVYESIDTTGFAVRKEILIDNTIPGTVVPAKSNGSKVAIGDTVANIYKSEAAAEAAARLTEINDEIEYYKSIDIGSLSATGADIAVYRTAITDSLFSLSSAIEEDNLSGVYSLSRSLREAIMKKYSATGETFDVVPKINSLTDEYNSLKTMAGTGTAVTVSQAGYYVDTADGFENIADYENILTYDAHSAEALLSSQAATVSSGNVGKLITDFNWYLVFNTTVEQLGNKVRGSTVTVMFGNSPVQDLEMEIKAVNATEGSNTVTVVLRSNIMNKEIAALRNEAVKIRVNSRTGIAVDKMALRTVDGEKGVYVREGNLVSFKKVDIIYSDANIILSKPVPLDSSYLAVYDEMILEGTDLYDGKLLV